jgi:prophage tail gpP-like protein
MALRLEIETATGQTYEVVRFKSFDVDLTLDIPADHFNVTIGDPVGAYANVFDGGDTVRVYRGDQEILSGIVDDIDEKDGDGIEVTFDGRDTSLLFLDNDAIPITLHNVDLLGLAKHFGDPYGRFKYDVEPGTAISKLVIDTGRVEWDVLEEEARKQGKRVWMGPNDTLTIKSIDYTQSPSYFFERYGRTPGAIPIETAERKRSMARRKSEVWVRSYNGESIAYKAQDEFMKKRGLSRRRVIEAPQSKSRADIERDAKESLDQSKAGSWEYTATVNGKYTVDQGKTAWVRDPSYGVDEVLFIVGVTYRMDSRTGSKTVVRMRKVGEAL